MTLFGNGVSADGIKARIEVSSSCIRVGPKSDDRVLVTGGEEI